MLLAGGMHKGRRQMLSSDAVKAMMTNHLTVAQQKDGEIILQESHGWGYGLSVPVANRGTCRYNRLKWWIRH